MKLIQLYRYAARRSERPDLDMTDQPRVSVIIPTYNHASFLREALQSVMDQTFSDWEAIVVNNYSEDNTVEVVESFRDSRIHLVNFHNHGVIGASRNKGIELAKSEWIAFLDSDDKWHRQKLKRCLEAIDAGADLVGHALAFVEEEKVVMIHKSGPEKSLTCKALLFGGRSRLTPSAVMVRKSSLEDVGGFSEKPEFVTSEDYDLWIRLARSGIRFKVIDDVLTDYRVHAANASSSIIRQMDSALAVIDSYSEVKKENILSRVWFKRSRGIFIYGAGRCFQKTGQRDEAMAMYWRSLLNFPFSLKTYAAMAQTLLLK